MDEILEKEADANNTKENEKEKKTDNAKAVEMWNRAMVSMRSTLKRKEGDEVKDVENVQPKPKSQGGVVGTQCHIYVRKMIWFRSGKLKN